jgi:hypothetical protein
MGLNTTGLANTNDYVLGRGIIRLALLDSTTGLPLGFRDLGNCPQFTITMTTEELKHFSSRAGLKVTDKRVTISQEISFGFQLDEISQQNFALFFTGENASTTNPAVAGVGAIGDKQTLTISGDVVQGQWYILRDEDSLVRTSFSSAFSGIVIFNETTMMAVATTEYTLDLEAGLVLIHHDAAGVGDGDNLSWYSSADASAPAKLQEMSALGGSGEDYALEFVQVNPANSDEVRVYEFHSVSVAADADFGLISDEFSLMSFKGTAQSNAVTGKTLTIRTTGAV